MVKYLYTAAFYSLTFRSEVIPQHPSSEKSRGCHGTQCLDNSFLSSSFDRNGTTYSSSSASCTYSKSNAFSGCHWAALLSLAPGRGHLYAGSQQHQHLLSGEAGLLCSQTSWQQKQHSEFTLDSIARQSHQGSLMVPKGHLLPLQKVLSHCIFCCICEARDSLRYTCLCCNCNTALHTHRKTLLVLHSTYGHILGQDKRS